MEELCMSIEQAILARSHVYIKRAPTFEIINYEAHKGCYSDLSYILVNLEPFSSEILGCQLNTAAFKLLYLVNMFCFGSYYTFPPYQNFQMQTAKIKF
jgi:hypothetical protein